jgi:hypothetical protein
MERHSKLGGCVEHGAQGQVDRSFLVQRQNPVRHHVTGFDLSGAGPLALHDLCEWPPIRRLQRRRDRIDVRRVGHRHTPRRFSESKSELG